MFELSDFYHYCQEHDVDVIPFPKAPSPGTTIRDGSNYAIFLDFQKIQSTRLLKGVCAHELGHVATGALHSVCSPFDIVERSEYRSCRWVAEHILTEDDFRSAFCLGYTELWQLSEFFDFPEEDIKKALSYWTERKGIDFNL